MIVTMTVTSRDKRLVCVKDLFVSDTRDISGLWIPKGFQEFSFY